MVMRQTAVGGRMSMQRFFSWLRFTGQSAMLQSSTRRVASPCCSGSGDRAGTLGRRTRFVCRPQGPLYILSSGPPHSLDSTYTMRFLFLFSLQDSVRRQSPSDTRTAVCMPDQVPMSPARDWTLGFGGKRLAGVRLELDVKSGAFRSQGEHEKWHRVLKGH